MTEHNTTIIDDDPVVQPRASANLWDALFQDRPVSVRYSNQVLDSRVYILTNTIDEPVEGETDERPVRRFDVMTKAPIVPSGVCRTDRSGRDSSNDKARIGEHHGRSKLTELRVVAIRAWAAPYLQQGLSPPWTERSRQEKVAEGTIRDIVFRRTWSHLQ